jgi:hypothetical protein
MIRADNPARPYRAKKQIHRHIRAKKLHAPIAPCLLDPIALAFALALSFPSPLLLHRPLEYIEMRRQRVKGGEADLVLSLWDLRADVGREGDEEAASGSGASDVSSRSMSCSGASLLADVGRREERGLRTKSRDLDFLRLGQREVCSARPH